MPIDAKPWQDRAMTPHHRLLNGDALTDTSSRGSAPMRIAAAARLLALATLAAASSMTLAAQQAHINLDWAPQRSGGSLLPFGADVISPEVTDQGMVTFRLKAPRAQEVQLSGGTIAAALGSTTSAWPFTRGADGTWSLTLGPIPQNVYVYKLVVDGVSVVDPNNTLGAFGNQPGYSTLVVHGKGPAYYDARPVPHGTITRHVYRSAVLDGEREIYVYTPPGYDRTKAYPVLYLLGGSGELAAGWWLDGRAGFIADNLIADGKAVPMIIAMPNNQVVHRGDPRHADLTFSLFDRELRTSIVPLVEAQYRTVNDRHGRALAGLSMGGRHTQLVGFKALDMFASFGVLSAGDPESEKSTPEFLKDPDINTRVDYLLVGLGTHEDQPTNRAVVFHRILEKHGVKHDYAVGGNGGHDWATWRWLLHERLLPNLFRPRK
jgi:enterochelin esterase-like enzyme